MITDEGLVIHQSGLLFRKKHIIDFEDIREVIVPEKDNRDQVTIILNNGQKLTLKHLSKEDSSKFPARLKGIVERSTIQKLLNNSTGFEEFNRGVSALPGEPGIDARHLVDVIIEKAIKVYASDVHLEPHIDHYRVRYRVDGIFYDAGKFDKDWAEKIISRIKVASDLIVYRRDIPQEGRIPFKSNDNAVDVRVSIVPTVVGEKAVLRVFDSERAKFTLSLLNFRPEIENALHDLILRPGGVILLTGPASSGKTTTMYACLKEITQARKETTNIVSIEDPVEYQLGIIQQMQIDPKKGLTFAKCLSAILRQDPEVLMVGEIRDTETAKICLQAGLTGHLVLSTIHCGRAHIVPVRLLDMGIEPFQIVSALKGCIALRLVRKNCPNCREPFQPSDAVMKKLEPYLENFEGSFIHGKGCVKCMGLGTLGRIPIAELLIMDDSVRKTISSKVTVKKLETIVKKKENYSLIDDAIRLIKSGDLNPEELIRVLEMD
ncbi:MAG: hypothetical protein A2161_16495 [Candidatus Schekmanbacteria bacterium RBG_13_48_7]|uniref:Bacterial type II secretion system protein E domain-containing protein n=1 Tax=Candidatus Schekmanbacteria bacterium RBG_13_48_7 TaxID=1817878 RepID=A0A1F7RWE6_9BACT|nr:MAG: hypothetical protein A2161_16495 [Candidatus Schekmanbacteria bacterium RBG_13_48_7]